MKTSVSETEPEKAVICAKCSQSNARGRNTCQACGAHLHICCKRCGERNPRARAKCFACGQRLHRPFWEKFSSRALGKRFKLTPAQMVLCFVFVLVAFKAIIWFSEMSSSPPPE